MNSTGTLTTRPAVLRFLAAATAASLVLLWGAYFYLAPYPAEIAVHWSGTTPDSSAAPAAFFLGVTAAVAAGNLLLAFGLKGMANDLSRRSTRSALASFAGVWNGIMAGAAIGTAHANQGAASWQDAGSPALPMMWLGAFAIAFGALGFLIGRRGPDQAPEANTPAEPLDVPPGTRLAWTGSLSNPALRWLLAAAAAVTALSGLLVADRTVSTWISLAVAVIGCLAAALLLSLTVSVGRDGVRVSFGPFAWPSVRTPLSEIEEASVQTRTGSEVGGWGWRSYPGGLAVMFRNGECLVLRRKRKPQLTISVDDAGRAAAVVNTLLRDVAPRS
ncbi:hypothetical protein [Salininema proteolyticum]|uniref:DUF1648 domain-containing protein n=1 Tax=Salininema proteolyticum TaxID=1607685 RepID=A0ABV8TZD5_9ACTN